MNGNTFSSPADAFSPSPDTSGDELNSGMTSRTERLLPAHETDDAASRRAISHLDANVGSGERIVATALGFTLLALGLPRRGIAGTTVAAAGGVLLWHGTKKHSFAYSALGIGSDDATATSHPLSRRSHSKVSMTIAATPSDLFSRWRDLSQLPRVFPHVESVIEHDAGISEWHVTLPGGRGLTWKARIIEEVSNRRLRWKSVQGSPFEHSGTISFDEAPGGRSTHVTLEQRYALPAGALGALIARVTGTEPRQEAVAALGRFRQLVETGTITDQTSASARAVSGDVTTETHRHDSPRQQSDLVDQASDESFPASDPPAHSGSTATPREPH